MITHNILGLSSLERSLIASKHFEGSVYKFREKKIRRMCIGLEVIMARSLKTQCLPSFANLREFFANFSLQ